MKKQLLVFLELLTVFTFALLATTCGGGGGGIDDDDLTILLQYLAGLVKYGATKTA